MSSAEALTAVSPIASPVEILIQLLKQAVLISAPMQEGVAEPNAISLNELKILMCLGGEGALAGHDITQIMGISAMNVSRALQALIERGWIENLEDSGNKRRKPVRLSEAGWQAYRAMTPDVAQVAEALLGDLSAAERVALSRTTAKIIARMEALSARQ